MQSELPFNPAPSTVVHIDINSCFATIEQQARPYLRGKPLAVAAYDTPNGVILAPSIEAKRYGIKTGMRVREGRERFPGLIVRTPDALMYRYVHHRFREILGEYTPEVFPKSIDEFVLYVRGTVDIRATAREIKERIRRDVGEWIWTSAGIGPTRFTAKVAAGMKKPDGLTEINHKNFLAQYGRLELLDLHGINLHLQRRLWRAGITTPLAMYRASLQTLKVAFNSVVAHYWYSRLRGWEVDDVEFARRSYGNSYSLPRPLGAPEELTPVLAKLVNKMAFRMRKAGYQAAGVYLSLSYKNGAYFNRQRTLPEALFDTRDIYKAAVKILKMSPYNAPVKKLAVGCFNLRKASGLQLELFEPTGKKFRAMEAFDRANDRWGDFVITTGTMLETEDYVPDRIAFGSPLVA